MMTKENPLTERNHPVEVLELYGPVLEKVTFLDDFNQASYGINQNQIQAREGILNLFEECQRRSEGVVAVILAPMFAGKTTTICLLVKELRGKDVLVYKHQLDLGRTGKKLVTNAGLSVEANSYRSIWDIDPETEVLIVDEFQFNEIDDLPRIEDFLRYRKERGLLTVISQLDFNFRREPWRTTETLVREADQAFVLRSKCHSCGRPAEFIQRNIGGEPDHINSQEILVGAGNYYQARCWQCQRVGGKPPSYLAGEK